jgi:hypothetical protein
MLTNRRSNSFLLSSTIARVCGVFGVAALAAQTGAGTIFDEITSGLDLDNNGATPTLLTVNPGFNELFGKTGQSTSKDPDYFTFNVPSGYALVSIAVLPDHTQPVPADPPLSAGLEFLGLQAGHQFTAATTPSLMLGYLHFNENSGEILDDLAIPRSPNPATVDPTTGFSTPLGAGNYAFWVQDTGMGEATYGLSFEIRSVPEAGPGFLSSIGALGTVLAAAGRRSKRTL